MNKPNNPTEEKIALRIPEAAAISGLSRSTLYKLLGTKQLTTVKVGRRRLILKEDLRALLRSTVA
jgi:excisionase family DNA binding protein